MLIVQNLWLNPPPQVIPYSEFRSLLKDGKIERVELVGQEIFFKQKYSPDDSPDKKQNFKTQVVDKDLTADLDEYKVEYAARPENTFFRDILSWVLPLGLFWLFLAYISKRATSQIGGGLLNVGKSKAKIYVETDTKVTFADVAGVDEAKVELKEVVQFLKSPKSYARLGAHMPKGVLLVGPPGTGKTLLAKAIAGEAGVPFFSISGSEFVEMFVGVGAARVRDLFDQARQKAPCIIFIDELDALGRSRATYSMGGHDEKEQTLNQLLAELDGFDSSSGIVLLAATNRPEILDPALLRSGRFDRQILVDRPDRVGRTAILNVHIKKIKTDPTLSIESVAALTAGFTGADLANLVNEAAIIATRANSDLVSESHFVLAIERIVAGLEKRNRLLNPIEKRIVAYHEFGHALVSQLVTKSDLVHKVSIIPRGIGSLGYTISRPTEDRYLMTKEELSKKMVVLLGGRAAEKLIFSHTSTGAADDLAKSTDIARNMVTRFGMDEKLGHVAYDTDPSPFLQNIPSEFRQKNYSEDTSREIDCAVRKLLNESFELALALLTKHQKVLVKGAELLLEKETLQEADLKLIFSELTQD